MKQDHAGRAGQGVSYPTRLSMILYFLKGSGRYFFAAVFSAALMALLDLINPRIVGYTVDSIIGDSSVETILPLRLLINALGGPVYLKTHLWTVSLTIVGVALAAAFSVIASAAATRPVLRPWSGRCGMPFMIRLQSCPCPGTSGTGQET